MSYLFGPVMSRRLGVSLGVDLVPFKTCTLDCIYCECGITTNKRIKREPFVTADVIMKELVPFLKRVENLDYITFSGSGEPTLNSHIGKLIQEIKKISDVSIAVLTNGTLLFQKEVRDELLGADLVLPSLDAVSKESFLKIDRPYKNLDIDNIIKGLIQFRKEFKGMLWLEVLLVKGVNDKDEEIDKMIDIVKQINPDKLQINTIDRPPAESFALPLEEDKLQIIYEKFYNNKIPVEIIAPVKDIKKVTIKENDHVESDIINLIKRRPETLNMIASSLGINIPYTNKLLRILEQDKKIYRTCVNSQTYYKVV